ncbi:LPXTG cell wall anchor domain-containing protein [Marisediminicola antarctica]
MRLSETGTSPADGIALAGILGLAGFAALVARRKRVTPH